MSGTAAVVDSPQTSEGQAWWFLDTLVVEHLMASGTGPVVLEMTLPAGAAPLLHLHHDLDDSSFLLDGQMGGAMWGPDAARPGRRLVVHAARGTARFPGGGPPACPHPAGA